MLILVKIYELVFELSYSTFFYCLFFIKNHPFNLLKRHFFFIFGKNSTDQSIIS